MTKGVGGRPKEYENFQKTTCYCEARMKKEFKMRLCVKRFREVKHLGMSKKDLWKLKQEQFQ